MKGSTEQEIRMNTQVQATTMKSRREAPLFASTWVALFLLLRREWSLPRSEK